MRRFQNRVSHNQEFADWLESRDQKKASKLRDCGTWLLWRQFLCPDQPPPKLAGGIFCQQPLICAFCAAGRSARHIKALTAKLRHVRQQNPDLVPYFLTLTARSQEDLGDMQRHVWGAWSKLMQRRRNTLAGRGSSVTGSWHGGFVSGEAKLGEGGHGWHYHLHGVVLAPGGHYSDRRSTMTQEWADILGQEWASTTFHPIKGARVSEDALVGGVAEAAKYAVKFEWDSHDQRWHAAQALHRVRNLRPFGSLYGVKLPDEITDDMSAYEDVPFVEWVLRFVDGGYVGEDLSYLRRTEFDDWNQGG